MNRQARVAGSTEWHDYGEVTHEKAARSEAENRHANSRIYDYAIPPTILIETRDAEHPLAVFTSEVTRRVCYEVKQYRGDGDE